MPINQTVAILMATYNGEKFLKAQLDSIFSQTYQNFKLYISDDKSSDSTVKIISKYQKKYPSKIFYTISKTNLGFLKNFEYLLDNCNEEYILLSDQDDIWLENKVKVQMHEMLKLNSLKKDTPCLVHSDLSVIDENGKLLHNSYFKYRNYKLKSTKDLGHLLGPSGTMGNTILMNKKLKDLILPFPDKLDFHDYWIGLNCELFGVRKTINSQLVKYRAHSSNSSNSIDKISNIKTLAISRDIKLPNLETDRKYYLPTLLHKITSKKDTKIFKTYLNYLTFNKGRLIIYLGLLNYSLVKRDTLFRIKLFFKIIVTNRY